jgi:hypothetical protein
MPRGKKITVKSGGARTRQVSAKVNHEEAEKIRTMLAREEEVIEADMRQELARMIDERDLKMSRDLGAMNSRNRQLMMWIGVSVIMLVIVVLWVSTLDLAVNNSYRMTEEQTDAKSLSEYKRNLDQTFGEVMTKIEQLKEQSRQIVNQASSTEAGVSSSNAMSELPSNSN